MKTVLCMVIVSLTIVQPILLDTAIPDTVLGQFHVLCALLLGRKQHPVYDMLQTLPVFPEKGQKTDS